MPSPSKEPRSGFKVGFLFACPILDSKKQEWPRLDSYTEFNKIKKTVQDAKVNI
jgi:hypothetical protein